jgi:hypothetical protein
MYLGLAEDFCLQITKKIGSANRKSANLTKCICPQTCAKQCGAYMILYPLYCTYYKEGFGSSLLTLGY